MSRMYDVYLVVHNFRRKKSKAIIKAAKKVWTFDDITFNNTDDPKAKNTHLEMRGEDNLCGGSEEKALAKDIAKAVFKANGGEKCFIKVTTKDLDAEGQSFMFD